MEFEYVIATNDSDLYFLAANLRQDLLADQAMCHTTLQKIVSVLACKARMEKISGPLSNSSQGSSLPTKILSATNQI